MRTKFHVFAFGILACYFPKLTENRVTICYSNGSYSTHRSGVTPLLRAIGCVIRFSGRERCTRLLREEYGVKVSLKCRFQLGHAGSL